MIIIGLAPLMICGIINLIIIKKVITRDINDLNPFHLPTIMIVKIKIRLSHHNPLVLI